MRGIRGRIRDAESAAGVVLLSAVDGPAEDRDLINRGDGI
jgi:hypothetical protein